MRTVCNTEWVQAGHTFGALLLARTVVSWIAPVSRNKSSCMDMSCQGAGGLGVSPGANNSLILLFGGNANEQGRFLTKLMVLKERGVVATDTF